MKKNRPPRPDKFKKPNSELTHFIESMGRYFESYGIPRIGGKILGLLLVAHEPLSAEDIASILKVSRGSISTNFRLLLTSALAEKVTFPGDRTTYFVFPATAWEKAMMVEIEGIAFFKETRSTRIDGFAIRRPCAHIDWKKPSSGQALLMAFIKKRWLNGAQ